MVVVKKWKLYGLDIDFMDNDVIFLVSLMWVSKKVDDLDLDDDLDDGLFVIFIVVRNFGLDKGKMIVLVEGNSGDLDGVFGIGIGKWLSLRLNMRLGSNSWVKKMFLVVFVVLL